MTTGGGLGADYGAMKISATAIPMSAGNTARQLMTMEDFGAMAIACTPSYALYLAETARNKGIIPRLKITSRRQEAASYSLDVTSVVLI